MEVRLSSDLRFLWGPGLNIAKTSVLMVYKKNCIIDGGISAMVDKMILKFNKLVLQMIFYMIKSLFISSEVPIGFITSDNPMAGEGTFSVTFVVGHVLCSRSTALSCESVQVPICAFF